MVDSRVPTLLFKLVTELSMRLTKCVKLFVILLEVVEVTNKVKKRLARSNRTLIVFSVMVAKVFNIPLTTLTLLEILTDKILPTCFIKLLLETLVIDNSLLVKNLAIVTILVSVTVIIFLKAFTITVAVVDNILNILPVDFTKAVVEVNAEESARKKTFPPVPLMTTLSIAKPLISIG